MCDKVVMAIGGCWSMLCDKVVVDRVHAGVCWATRLWWIGWMLEYVV